MELIEAFVEGYRGGRDAPGFDACVRAEINKRFAGLYKAMPCEQVHFSEGVTWNDRRTFVAHYMNYEAVGLIAPDHPDSPDEP